MGEPIQVLELAKDMIKLSGMTVKDEKSPDGDIEIIFTGLRPGEKLYEELLISENVDVTEHEKIMRATEGDLEWEDLQQYLAALEHATEIDDYKKIRAIFLNTISGFNPDTEIADAMYS
jgi:FlaA1/EpsC-like NDP-sugar epimerase